MIVTTETAAVRSHRSDGDTLYIQHDSIESPAVRQNCRAAYRARVGQGKTHSVVGFAPCFL